MPKTFLTRCALAAVFPAALAAQTYNVSSAAMGTTYTTTPGLASQNITLHNSSSSSGSYGASITNTSQGFSITPSIGSIGGNASVTLAVSINTTGKLPGNYMATYTITGGTNGPQSGAYSETVNGLLTASPSAGAGISFNITGGSASPQSLQVNEAAGYNIAVEAAYSGNNNTSAIAIATSTSPAGPSADATTAASFNVIPNLAGLSPGATASGSIYLTCPNNPCGNTPIKIPVTVTLQGSVVPNVVGLTQSAATSALSNSSFTLGTITRNSSSTVPAGNVISQSPAAGASANPGTAVNLVVSTGAASSTVPNLTGMSRTGAASALQNAGLTLGNVNTIGSSTTGAGSVVPIVMPPASIYPIWNQIPAAGSAVAPGTAVNIMVSSGPPPPVTTSPLYFTPVLPCHVADTRAGFGTSSVYGPPQMVDGETRTFNLTAGSCPGIPSSAKAFSIVVTALAPGYLGFMQIWPSDQLQPAVSTLNAPQSGGSVSNAAIVPAGAGGSIDVYVTQATDVAVDINGYFDTAQSSTAYSFYPLAAPCRVADTQWPSGGTLGGPDMRAGEVRTFNVRQSVVSVPGPGYSPCPQGVASAKVYTFNVGAQPGGGSLNNLVIWPSSAPQPGFVQNLSVSGGQDAISVSAMVQGAASDGSVNIYTTDASRVFFDISGYFAPPGAANALVFHPVAPCRVIDTTIPVSDQNVGASVNVPVLSAADCHGAIPSTAKAYSFNATVQPTSGVLWFLTLSPTGQISGGTTSTLNSFDGRVISNAAIVGAGSGGQVTAHVTQSSRVIIDLNGYFSAQ